MIKILIFLNLIKIQHQRSNIYLNNYLYICINNNNRLKKIK